MAMALKHPDLLNNETIRAIGRSYLHHHSAPKNFLSRLFDRSDSSNRPIAKRLTDFSLDTDPYTKWYFLATCYASLKTNSPMAIHIHSLFATTFNNNLSSYKLIHRTGKLFEPMQDDKEHSAKEISFMLRLAADRHYVNALRNKVKEANINIDNPNHKPTAFTDAMLSPFLQKLQPRFFNKPAYTDSYQRWLALAEAYASLPASKGPVSDAIIRLFQETFGCTVYTRRIDLCHEKTTIDPELVAEGLKGVVISWYADHFRQALRLDHGSVLARDSTRQLSEPLCTRTLT